MKHDTVPRITVVACVAIAIFSLIYSDAPISTLLTVAGAFVAVNFISMWLGARYQEELDLKYAQSATQAVEVPVVEDNKLMLLQEDSSVLRALKIFQAAGIKITEPVLQALPRAATAIEAYQNFDVTDIEGLEEQVELMYAQIEMLKRANESFAATNEPPKFH